MNEYMSQLKSKDPYDRETEVTGWNLADFAAWLKKNEKLGFESESIYIQEGAGLFGSDHSL